jgi:hypothetical protein
LDTQTVIDEGELEEREISPKMGITTDGELQM